MFLDGMMRMYLENPATFWQFLLAITPALVMGFVYGLLEQSRQLCKKPPIPGRNLRFILRAEAVNILWASTVYQWLPSNGQQLLGASFMYFIMLFPLIGAAIAGIHALNVYWFIRKHWPRFHFS
jgi:hypothetical protein